MYALSVRSPWAEAIASGDKRVENRSKRTHHRGPLAIHRCGPGGAIIAVVDVVDCITAAQARKRMPEQAHHISGPWCWVLSKPRTVTPVPCKGQVGLWLTADL